MIAYGDPQRTVAVAETLRDIHARATEIRDLDSTRDLLVLCGQVEQALADLGLAVELAESLTDWTARIFCAQFLDDDTSIPTLERDSIRRAVMQLRDAMAARDIRELSLKVPEGFAFYSLYPEQYCLSAGTWSEAQSPDDARTVAVLGLRSIGTTLSAVVAETLRRHGWRAERRTLRPGGHPYSRTADVPPHWIGVAQRFLIVDEGPGRSGSSMASVALALQARGVPATRICFMPAHANGPGEAAAPETRACWSSIPSVVTPLSGVRWHGASLEKILLAKTSELVGVEARELRDSAAGRWRQYAFRTRADWPAVPKAFERPKYLAELAGGRAWLKFTGFGNAPVINRAPPAACENGIRPLSPIASISGWSLFRWIEGDRLQLNDIEFLNADRIAAHLRATMGPELSATECDAAFDRLESMLRFNARQVLGPECDARVEAIVAAAKNALQQSETCAASEVRLAPHDFIRSNGAIWKASGPALDHTIAGTQPFVWSVAMFAVEWGADDSMTRDLCRRATPLARPIPQDVLKFHQAACAALRLGMFAMSAHASERAREARAVSFYRAALHRALQADA
jgi:hypothetical protein